MAQIHSFISYVILFSILCISSVITTNNLEEGDNCHHDEKNLRGICTELKDCLEALDEVKHNKLPQICGFKKNLPIVCCTKINEPQPQINRVPGEISKQKCEEYGQLVFKKEEIPSFSAGSEPVYVNVTECNIDSGSTFVHNGEDAKSKEFPHMALLGYGEKNKIEWGCGGTLISEQYILTAAHCLSGRELGLIRWVRVGDLDYKRTDDDAAPQDFSVAEIIRHPNYKRPSLYHDIALIKLNKPVTFTDYVRPACLHIEAQLPINKFLVSGWGRLAHDRKELSDVLQKADVDEFNIQECNMKYDSYSSGSKLRNGIIDETQICAGGKDHDRDTCKGDSGGPLQIFNPKVYCMYSIIGVTSFGQPNCGVTGIPAIYTRVSHYIDWIEKVVWP